MSLMDTIVAPATAPVASGVAVLRLSGPRALAAALPFCPEIKPHPTARHAYVTTVRDEEGRLLDEGLFLYFQAPHSYTGEDVVELQLHGSPRLMTLVEKALVASGEVRRAAPGEFTRRAFLNGRLDLARAEAVADLVSAESEAAVRAAAAQLRGSLGIEVARLREPLLALRADLEGLLDFPDDTEDVEEELALESRLGALAHSIHELVRTVGRGRLVRRGARVALFGPVNAGKSTLFNALLGEARALVDADPGTTRDVLEARLEVEGLSLTLLDTAGLRESPDRLEGMGIARAREAVRTADLAVLVLPPDITFTEAERWRAEAGDTPLLVVRSKSDLPHPGTGADGAAELAVSAHTGLGVEALRAGLGERLLGAEAQSAVVSVSERHAEALRQVGVHLQRALQAYRESTLEVVSGELGLALETLGTVTGEDASEALLDEVFRRFCIGK